jgi:pimeloyl-ACP methyl ester carboxylesterase
LARAEQWPAQVRLRGLSADAAYVASGIDQTPGPVLAVGHSYGGGVITNACIRTDNVVGLVYVAAFAPDEGEKLGELVGSSKDSVLTAAVVESQYPTGQNSGAPELIIDPTKFRAVLTADPPQLQSDVLGLSQRPIAADVRGTIRPARMEEPAHLGRRRHVRHRGRHRHRAVHGQTRPRRHHRNRQLTRRHDLPARRRHGRDPQSAQGP